MSNARQRLHEDLLKLSEGYRNLVPAEQTRHLDDGVEAFLVAQYPALRDAVRAHLSKLPAPPGKDDSWSW